MSDDRHVIVTGASRGIGLEIAADLLAHGYGVTAVARQPSHALAQLRAEHGDALDVIAADVATARGRTRIVDGALRRGELYALVNNAGVAADGLLVRQCSADIARMVEVNLVAPIELARAVTAHLLRRRKGRIVSISSVAASRAYSGLAVYSATKAGLEGFTRSLAREIGPRGVTVNAVAPGFVDTAMSASLDDEQRRRVARRTALPESATAADVASVVRFLLAPDADRLTGMVLAVDAGAGL